MSLNQKKKLKKGTYKVNINSSLKGYMNYGEIFKKVEKERDFFSYATVIHLWQIMNYQVVYHDLFFRLSKKIKLNYSIEYCCSKYWFNYCFKKNYKR